MNFITGLPKAKEKSFILVVIDRLSKYVFLALSRKFLSIIVAQIFIVGACKLHGMPHNIVLDCDPIFMGSF